MTDLKYKIITSKKQYSQYCAQLEELVGLRTKNKDTREEIALLTLLIEKWDTDHSTLNYLDPIQLLISLMKDHNMRAADLSNLTQVSKGYISEILHYRKGLSKDMIRKLAEHFRVSQEAFNREYPLVNVQKESVECRL